MSLAVFSDDGDMNCLQLERYLNISADYTRRTSTGEEDDTTTAYNLETKKLILS